LYGKKLMVVERHRKECNRVVLRAHVC
jgi:hypothetical protein